MNILTSRRSILMRVSGLTLGLLLAGAIPAKADALDDIVKAGVIKIGIFEDFPPFASLGTDMQIQGYDVDMADAHRQGPRREAGIGRHHRPEPHSLS